MIGRGGVSVPHVPGSRWLPVMLLALLAGSGETGRGHDPPCERPFDRPCLEVATVRRGCHRNIAEHGSALQLLLVGADEDGGERDDSH